MYRIQLCVVFLLLFLVSNQLSAKCDCKGNDVITVCQNGQTKRVNCSAQTSPNVFCGPCEQKPNCKAGDKCNDGNPCTNWDMYDAYCNCNGKLADADNDGVCDAKDICPNGDDLKDWNKNGMPDDCENRPPPNCSGCEADENGMITICWIPLIKENMKSVRANCDWLADFFDEKGKLKGKSHCGPCQCESIGDKDSDGDGVCDKKDECPNDASLSKSGACGCAPCPVDSSCDSPCRPQGDSEYEWIDKVSLNQIENQSGDNGGYADFKHLVLELGQGDSLSIWVFPDFLDDQCVLSIRGYIDWNGDCDFDDAGELIFDNRTSGENGADIAVPQNAAVGDATVRIILHNGRLKSACQDCIDGEVEDYTLRIFTRSGIQKPISLKDPLGITKSMLQVYPNPIMENSPFVVKVADEKVKNNELTVLNSSGQLMFNSTVDSGENLFNSEALGTGAYIFELKNDFGVFRQKVIIAK